MHGRVTVPSLKAAIIRAGMQQRAGYDDHVTAIRDEWLRQSNGMYCTLWTCSRRQSSHRIAKLQMAQHNVGMQSWSDIELCVFGRCAVRVEPREKSKEILCAVFVKTDRETDMVRFMACSSGGRDSQHQREARLRNS